MLTGRKRYACVIDGECIGYAYIPVAAAPSAAELRAIRHFLMKITKQGRADCRFCGQVVGVLGLKLTGHLNKYDVFCKGSGRLTRESAAQ